MKKILAVVLALVMTLAMGTAAFAAVEVAPGQIYFGPASSEYYANPGDTITLDFRFAGNPNETDDYPTEGYAVIPFFGAIGDINYNEIVDCALTQEAIDAGVSFITDANSAYYALLDVDQNLFYGAFIMPASLIASDFTVFTITTTISTDWVVENYVARDNIAISFDMGSDGLGDGWFITDEEAEMIKAGEMLVEETEMNYFVNGLFGDIATIFAMPYQPTWEESFTEQLKGIGSALLDVLSIGINLLKGELAPSDWFIPGEHDVVDLSFVTDAIAKLVAMILHA